MSYMQAALEGLRAVNTIDIDFVPKLDAETLANCRSANNLQGGSPREKIYVRLLLSIDRHETTEAAMETVPNPEEIHAMLDFCLGRIGHACCFEEDHWRKLKSSKTPVRVQIAIPFFKSMRVHTIVK